MKSVVRPLSQFLKGLRVIAIIGICALLLLTSATPALAFGSRQASPSEGTEPLNGVLKESQDAMKGAPEGQEDIKKANEGLNGVQGAADADRMNKGSSQATSVKEEIVNALENVTGKK